MKTGGGSSKLLVVFWEVLLEVIGLMFECYFLKNTPIGKNQTARYKSQSKTTTDRASNPEAHFTASKLTLCPSSRILYPWPNIDLCETPIYAPSSSALIRPVPLISLNQSTVPYRIFTRYGKYA
jgi:hypothetical protein